MPKSDRSARFDRPPNIEGQTKICKTCGLPKPPSDYRWDRRGAYVANCDECRRAYFRAWSALHPRPKTVIKEKNHEYWERKRSKEREKNRRNSQRRRRQLRMRVLQYYGGDPPCCACCGEGLYEFLCIDHIGGGGGFHRQKMSSGNPIYSWIERHDYPDGFQVLCHNCNMALGLYGYCPHTLKDSGERTALYLSPLLRPGRGGGKRLLVDLPNANAGPSNGCR